MKWTILCIFALAVTGCEAIERGANATVGFANSGLETTSNIWQGTSSEPSMAAPGTVDSTTPPTGGLKGVISRTSELGNEVQEEREKVGGVIKRVEADGVALPAGAGTTTSTTVTPARTARTANPK